MAKIYGLMTDLHFGIKKGSQTILEWQKKAINEAVEVFSTNNVTDIVILGDSFENRRNNLNYILDEYVRFVYGLLDRFQTVTILVGNHDMPFTNSMDSNIISTLFKQADQRIRIVDHPIENDGILFLPWIYDPDDLERVLKTKAKYLLGHLELNGFRMTMHDHECQHGLNAGLFKKFKMVLTGHFHLKQTIGNITYLGTMTPLSWNEYGVEHGVHVFSQGVLDFYPLQTNMFTTVRCKPLETEELETLKGKIVKVIIRDTDLPEVVEEFMNKINNVCFDKSIVMVGEEKETFEDLEKKIIQMNDDEIIQEYVDKFLPDRFEPESFLKLYRKLEEKINEIS